MHRGLLFGRGSVGLVLLILGAIWGVGCSAPPQVVGVTPQPKATGFATDGPLSVQFDRPMDSASVAAHFRLEPQVHGTFSWPSDHEVVFSHETLRPSTRYRVVLDPGYRDRQGSAAPLRHSWYFDTEEPPRLIGASPGANDTGVDPAAYLSLTFSRAMDVASLNGSVSLSPSLTFQLRQDPADPRRLEIAPSQLLAPDQDYSISVAPAARDVHGNVLATGSAITFRTGQVKSLQHWVGFIATPVPSGAGEGIWLVNESGFPRPLVAATVAGFQWAPSGDRLLLRSASGTWSESIIDGSSNPLPFAGRWASYLDSIGSFALLDGDRLRIWSRDSGYTEVAQKVLEAAVSPGGRQIAYTTPAESGTAIRLYDAGLKTESLLEAENAAVDGLAWAPDLSALAYRSPATDPNQARLRVRSLRGGSSQPFTVTTGQISPPIWQSDARHLLVTAPVPTKVGLVAKAFRLSSAQGQSQTLSAASGLPAEPQSSVEQLSPSPDGHQIAFISSTAGVPQVWLMNADGSRLTQLTRYGVDGYAYGAGQLGWTRA
ncbi:MAG: Ig-like domain-containing protein [Candidatus Dormibacteraeota bacterium]|uniref:Ig-like domain-containing protein n=1 Tax=Candidatus Dormiibacter inghamiae TaxID=3127013 RepID=A0A934KFE8_9BACT|nr:Ig-like domain-containing protein [Candidatus Dormibacteraeota bacterium]MBJ7605700.1 Ig-like domain-containing protein [Candidatus Dormibacteraeota bacterium]